MVSQVYLDLIRILSLYLHTLTGEFQFYEQIFILGVIFVQKCQKSKLFTSYQGSADPLKYLKSLSLKVCYTSVIPNFYLQCVSFHYVHYDYPFYRSPFKNSAKSAIVTNTQVILDAYSMHLFLIILYIFSHSQIFNLHVFQEVSSSSPSKFEICPFKLILHLYPVSLTYSPKIFILDVARF